MSWDGVFRYANAADLPVEEYGTSRSEKTKLALQTTLRKRCPMRRLR